MKIIKANKYFFLLALCCFGISCKKEHLDPKPSTPASNMPVVFIITKMNGDSVYYGAGLNGYSASTSYVGNNNNHTFYFILQQDANPTESYFKISVNSTSNSIGDPQVDLDSSIYVSSRPYGSGIFFVPLAAEISWFDSTGTEYNSIATNPNYFTINSVEDIEYESKKYKKTSISFECFLLNNFSDTIRLEEGEATVLFSVD